LALATLNAVLAVPELALRSAGFQHVSGIQFGYPDAREFSEFELDQELFWKLPSDGALVNSWGFFGPEPAIPKPSATRRIVFLGDSCSQQGYPQAWPELATARLAQRVRVDEVNLALSGYSTHQGRVLAERHLAELAPDLVVVYFGWNDHWLAHGAVDHEKRTAIRLEWLRRRSRLLQWVRSVTSPRAVPPLDVARVPPQRFEDNLRAIAAAARAAGARVVFVTAPSTHDLGLPAYLVERGFAASAAAALELHRDYAARVRTSAGDLGVDLFDLAAAMERAPERRAWFLEDGIHFTELGRHAVAELFVARVAELGLLP
jgi:lysophospholipase L1-like esterase